MAWSSVFIIDPLYTVWLLIGVLVAAFAGPRLIAGRLITVGLVVSTAYLGWSLVAKTLVDREADRALVAMGLGDAPRFSVPMPANTVLWRVVAMTDDGYVEGFRSLAADRGPMQFTAYSSDVAALRENAGLPAVQRLAWFNHGFMGAAVDAVCAAGGEEGGDAQVPVERGGVHCGLAQRTRVPEIRPTVRRNPAGAGGQHPQ